MPGEAEERPLREEVATLAPEAGSSANADPAREALLALRRERVFLALSGVFLGAMVMLNIIGLTRFVHIGPLALAVGVLPYPLTFLATDLISELYGRRRARDLVLVGFGLNVLVVLVMIVGRALPAVAPESQPPWQTLALAEPVALPDGTLVAGEVELFTILHATTTGAVLASMLAYLAAQMCDVYLFHFWKRVTGGRHLWLRNNGSTLVSQAVDSLMVISVTFGAAFLRGELALGALLVLMGSNYLFKMAAALVDTLPFYLGVRGLSRYLEIDPART